MARKTSRRSLRWRLEQLEAELRPHEEPSLRIGLLRQLPADYTGERHIAIVWQGEMDGGESYTFEERRGPEPPGPPDTVPRLCLTQNQLKIIGDWIED